MRNNKKVKNVSPLKHPATWGAVGVVFLFVSYFGLPILTSSTYSAPTPEDSTVVLDEPDKVRDEEPKAAHIPTPTPVRAVYMTQCVVGTPSFREKIVSLIEETELNSVVIDIKDFTGKVAFPTDNPAVSHAVSDQCGARDMRDFIERLHAKGIYVIGRITVFQDPYYTKIHPELAVKRASATSTVWTDYKGLSFIDVSARPFWDYIVELSRESYAIGFDELNYDYIRFPSDGNMKDIYYPHSKNMSKADALERFFSYLHRELAHADVSPNPAGVLEEGRTHTGPVLSADLFGMTATNIDDLNIGQVLERAFPYFDHIAPMVYPSHYPSGFNGWAKVNDHPYDIVKFSMDSAVRRAVATTTPVKTLTNTRIGTSTPAIYTKESYDPSIIRPWLQDFDYPVPYTPDMVTAQLQATYDAGLDSWMLWDPANTYTRSVLQSTLDSAPARQSP